MRISVCLLEGLIALKIGAAALSVVLPTCQQLLDRRGELQTFLSIECARLLSVLVTRSLLVDEIAVEVGRAISRSSQESL